MQKSNGIRTNTWIGTAATFGILVFLISACEHTVPLAPNSTLEAKFSSIQNNILTPSCVNQGCHPGGGAPMSLQSGLAYSNLVGKASAYGIPRVDPGKPDNSALYLKLIGDGRTGGAQFRMPLFQPALPPERIEAVRQWIANGAMND